MTDNKARVLLNCNQELQKAIPIFKESMIRFYGEDSRDSIERIFTNTIFVGYESISDQEGILHECLRQKEEELQELFQKFSPYPVKELLGKTSLENEKLHFLHHYEKLIHLFQLGKEKRKQEFLEGAYHDMSSMMKGLTKEEFYEMIEKKRVLEKYQQSPKYILGNLEYCWQEDSPEKEYQREFDSCQEFLSSICENNLSLEEWEEKVLEGEFSIIDAIIPFYHSILVEYHSYKEKWAEYLDNIEEEKKRLRGLEEEAYKEWIQKNIDWIPEEKRSNLEAFMKNPYNTRIVDPLIPLVFGHGLHGLFPIDAFSEAKEKDLHNKESSAWWKENIKKNRIEYFRQLGFDLGSNYEDYENNPEVQKIWPDTRRVESLLATRKRIIDITQRVLYETSPSHKEIREEMRKRGLLDEWDGITGNIYQRGQTFVNPNIHQVGDHYELSPICVIYFGNNTDSLDHYIVHELNHLVELHLQGTTKYTYSYICGWDSGEDYMKQTDGKLERGEPSNQKRPFETLNEIINELIAQEISEQMENDNIHVFTEKDKSKYRHTTSYEVFSFLVRDFFQYFKEEILKSRRGGNIEVLFQAVGKENVDALNDLCNECVETFGGFKIYRLQDDLAAKKETEQTKMFKDYLQRRNDILEKMINHYKTYLIETKNKESNESNNSETTMGNPNSGRI